MALYAFDGTWGEDRKSDLADTNVVRFKELYQGKNVEYLEGVGTRAGILGRYIGGLFGAGGRSRIDEMMEELERNYKEGDRDIDLIGYSRGAALAIHFANKIAQEGIDGEHPPIRFLGLWDTVASFGLPFDTIIDFQQINLGWDINSVSNAVKQCCHAMALNERRETFGITRLNADHGKSNIEELWFRGIHGDIGGDSKNTLRSNIALNWMLERAVACGLPIDTQKAKEPKYSQMDQRAKIAQHADLKRDPPRDIKPSDRFHPSADCKLAVGEAHECVVEAALFYNFSGVELEEGAQYELTVEPGQQWEDGGIDCGPEGWTSDQLSFLKETVVDLFDQRKRHPDANWFELIGTVGDDDHHLMRVIRQSSFKAAQSGPFYLFANDLFWRYANNEGSLKVTIRRTS